MITFVFIVIYLKKLYGPFSWIRLNFPVATEALQDSLSLAKKVPWNSSSLVRTFQIKKVQRLKILLIKAGK